MDDIVFKQAQIFGTFCLSCRAPVSSEDKLADTLNIKALIQQGPELFDLLRLSNILVGDGNGLPGQIVDELFRAGSRSRSGKAGGNKRNRQSN